MPIGYLIGLRPNGRRRTCLHPLIGSVLCLVALSACTDSHGGPVGTINSEPAFIERTETLVSATGDPASADDKSLCDGLSTLSTATIANPLLVEASGLAVSQQFDEVLWAHNDSGSETTLFALGSNGEDLASFSLPEIGGVDIEDMSLIDGTIHLADIGDNEQRRDSVFIYRFPEPDPFSVSDQVDNRAEIVDVDVIELVYEDKAHDAESFLIDPVTNDAVVIAKTFRVGGGRGTLLSPAPADVFTAPLPDRTATTTPSTTPTILRRAGSVALDQLAVDAVATGPPDALFTQVGLDGLATGAAIRDDGEAIAVRTYGTVWLYPRSQDQSVAEALSSQPCEAPTVQEAQGEAIDFLSVSDLGFVTLSEGSNPTINVTEPQPR